MKQLLVTMVLVVGIVASLPTAQAATNEIDKIEYNTKDRNSPQVRWILNDIFSKLPDFTVGGK